MFEHRPSHCLIEPLEARIAPALMVVNPLADLTVGPGKTGVDVDLSHLFDPDTSFNAHTIVTLETNFDSDPIAPGIQASSPIVIEMFDDAAPLTVQNFLSYITNADPKANYKDTFFHRLATGFVVQGGGFNANTPGAHIPTEFDVHNEFDGVNRSNLRGTIATAKSNGPNTANSEWFFNLADNSSNLDNQNGGFTVFAKVIQGMDVVDGIAALRTFNFSGENDTRDTPNPADDVPPIGTVNGASKDLPLQNYNTDPDGNPNTPAPTPSVDNVIRLTKLTVTAPPAGNPAATVGYSFNAAVDVVDAATNLPSDLVSGSVTGSKLHLNYKPHAAGIVKVTVHGSDSADASTAADTFIVNLQPNLVSNFDQDPFDGIIIGGDTKTSNIVIGNNGGGSAVGNVDVKVYLSKIGGADSSGTLVEPDRDILIGSFPSQPIDIASGGSVILTKSLQIPKVLAVGSDAYRVLVQVTPSNAAIAERFADDNVSLDSNVHLWENRFGTIVVNGAAERTDARLIYQEADGDMVEFTIASKGSGQIAYDGTFADLTVTDSKAGSVLKGKLISDPQDGERDIDLHNIELTQYIGSVKIPHAALNGIVGASHAFGRLTLGTLTGDGVISIGKVPAGKKSNPSLKFGSVSDFSIESLARIKSLRAAEWIDTDGLRNRIAAPSIGSIGIHGNLEANIGLANSGTLGSLHVVGFFRNADLVVRGDIGKVSVGGLDHAKIYAGVTTRPNDAGDFSQATAIASLSVNGVAGFSRAFIASNVAAAHIGPIFVKGIGGSGGLGKFGIVADSIKSYNRQNFVTAGKLKEPQVFDKRGRYSLTIV